MLGFPVDNHVPVKAFPVFIQQIPQGLLRACALPRRHDGHAPKVVKGLHRVALFHNVEHTQRVHRQGHNLPLCLLIQHRRQICRDAGHVQLSLNQLGRHLVGRRGQRKGVVVGKVLAAFGVVHQLYKAHGGGPLQRGNGISGGLRRLRGCRTRGPGGVRPGFPAGRQSQHQHGGQQHPKKLCLFHWFYSFIQYFPALPPVRIRF
ncbi:hypothetical protein SDC9_117191 [bioreactor metagenome]|uniref:Uncharacterized protein n=1 Tax=bioreactor metagenome TaxID=1076179 RepID=A0A645BYP5_9ZZZZ